MSDFIDNEASEGAPTSSEDEDFSDGGTQAKKRTKKASSSGKKSAGTRKAKKSREVIDSSDEEEDDEEDAEEMKDLINDEEEEEDESDSGSSDEEGGAKRSHDNDDESSSLEEDDIDLIRENTGYNIDKRKKFKRIRTLVDSDEEEADEGRKIQNELFGPSDLLESDDEEVNKPRSRPVDRDLDLDVDEDDESDSEDNFIVDDNDQPVVRKPKKKGAKYTDSAMQQAQEIFGVDFDYDVIEDDGDEDGYEDEYEYEDEDETGEYRARKPRAGRKTIYEVYEPAELERSHMTAFDARIRAKDEPERFQLRITPVTEAKEDELEEEASWIFQTAFDQRTISIQEAGSEPIAGKRSEIIKPEIQYALNCIRNEKLEVPFISAYRREYVPSISSNFDDAQDLWTIYRYDEQWCRLQSTKKKILALYTDMRDYIKSLPEDPKIRKVEDLDILRVKEARTFLDMEDARMHFKLYYSSLVHDMKLSSLQKKIDEKQKEKQAAKANRLIDSQSDGQTESQETVSGRPDKEGTEDEEREDEQEDEEEETEEEKLFRRLSQFKISNNRDIYARCRQDGLSELVAKFGLSPEHFGQNMQDDYQRNTVSQHQTRPLDEAANYLKPGTRFVTKEAILRAATYMFSREISTDPLVRQTVRKYYFENAVINVKPTTLGMKEIDESHPCYSFKFLKNKKVIRLQSEQFLHIVNAEKDKLLQVHFSIEPIDSVENKRGHLSPYFESLKGLFYSDFSSLVTKEWNDLRGEAVLNALNKFLLPSFEKQLRERLIKEAQDKIIKDSCAKLGNWLNVAPYAPAPAFDDYEDFELRNGTRICGFTFSPDGDAPCFAAIVDSEGELLDHVRLPYLNIRKRPDRMSALERENHAKDRIKFKQFMSSKKPHAVALAADTIQTKYICQDLAPILDELREHDGLPLIPIEIVDSELSNIYMNLKRANEEFPEFPPLLLKAISTARKLNDPLTEYSKLCTADNDVLCIRFHTLQDDLPKDQFLECLYQRFVTRTNAVGVDPNRAIAHPHTSDIVQFVAGLGPRKAAHLLRSIKKSSTGGQLVSREQLVKELGMTRIVFMNCAGFIKLDTDTLNEYYPDEPVTPLDSTRIHPQSYGLAKKIASDALDYEEGASNEATANSVEEILECPEKLDDLDLGAFARQLDEVQHQGRKGYTLQSIREEFQCRYKDHREPYKAPSQEEIFAMLTKETPATFYRGKLIMCQVVDIPRRKPYDDQLDSVNPVRVDETNLWRCPFCLRSDFLDLGNVWNHYDTKTCPGYAIGVRCKLDNGLFGFIKTQNLSDKEVTDPSDRFKRNMTLYARIIKIDTDKFSCDLTCKTSDLQDDKYKPPKDDDYDYNAEGVAQRDLEAKSKRQTRRPYCKRVIVHPSFENIDCAACERKLANMEQGHAIIRPSSAGQNFLTVSWKVADNINNHILVREEDKENAFSLGHKLIIDKEVYEDLDEILARHVQPMASFARELLSYKYCLKPPKDVEDEEAFMSQTLLEEKARAPNVFPYRFLASKKLPGKFLLGYLPNANPKIEYLTVTPAGYRFRKLYHKNLHSLIKWFKTNWDKVAPPSYPAVPPPPPAVNYENPMASLRQTFPMSQ